jgi:hypothetical protein
MGTVDERSHGVPVREGVIMSELRTVGGEAGGDYVHFLPAGSSVKGEFHCAECGYGVTVYRTLPVCPMCGGGQWEQSAWSPLSRARNVRQ